MAKRSNRPVEEERDNLVIDETRFEPLPIGKLLPAPWNYKGDDDTLKEKLKANLSRRGQVINVIVREVEGGFFEVCDGNHRLAAMTELGFKHVMCYNAGPVSVAEAMRVAIEMNETRFETKALQLADLMKEINSEFSVQDLAATMPYSQEDLQSMIDMAEFDWDQFKKTDPPDAPTAPPVEEKEEDGTVSGVNDEIRTVLLRVPKEVYLIWLSVVNEINQSLGGGVSAERAFELILADYNSQNPVKLLDEIELAGLKIELGAV
jgi:hypothetical protein